MDAESPPTPSPTPEEAASPVHPTLAGPGVTLRPVLGADLPSICAILDEPEVARWWRRAEWERVDEIDATSFAIVADAAVVGCIQYIEETDPDYYSAAVDVFISARVFGRGVGGAAMATLLGHLIDVRGHHRVTVDPAAANARAIHVYEKLGFRRVGVLRDYERTSDGTWRDALLMELLAGELRG